MKKKLFKLISSYGYAPSYSGKTGILYCYATTMNNQKCNNNELREHINDLIEKEATSKDDVFFDEIQFTK